MLRLFSNTKKEHSKISIPRIKEYDSYSVQQEEDFSLLENLWPKILTLYPTGDPGEGIRRGNAHK